MARDLRAPCVLLLCWTSGIVFGAQIGEPDAPIEPGVVVDAPPAQDPQLSILQESLAPAGQLINDVQESRGIYDDVRFSIPGKVVPDGEAEKDDKKIDDVKDIAVGEGRNVVKQIAKLMRGQDPKELVDETKDKTKSIMGSDGTTEAPSSTVAAAEPTQAGAATTTVYDSAFGPIDHIAREALLTTERPTGTTAALELIDEAKHLATAKGNDMVRDRDPQEAIGKVISAVWPHEASTTLVPDASGFVAGVSTSLASAASIVAASGAQTTSGPAPVSGLATKTAPVVVQVKSRTPGQEAIEMMTEESQAISNAEKAEKDKLAAELDVLLTPAQTSTPTVGAAAKSASTPTTPATPAKSSSTLTVAK